MSSGKHTHTHTSVQVAQSKDERMQLDTLRCGRTISWYGAGTLLKQQRRSSPHHITVKCLVSLYVSWWLSSLTRKCGSLSMALILEDHIVHLINSAGFFPSSSSSSSSRSSSCNRLSVVSVQRQSLKGFCCVENNKNWIFIMAYSYTIVPLRSLATYISQSYKSELEAINCCGYCDYSDFYGWKCLNFSLRFVRWACDSIRTHTFSCAWEGERERGGVTKHTIEKTTSRQIKKKTVALNCKKCS